MEGLVHGAWVHGWVGADISVSVCESERERERERARERESESESRESRKIFNNYADYAWTCMDLVEDASAGRAVASSRVAAEA